MVNKYIGRLSVDWTLKNVPQGNQETFLSAHPMDWHKSQSFWLPTAFFTIYPFKPFVESPLKGDIIRAFAKHPRSAAEGAPRSFTVCRDKIRFLSQDVVVI
jgi:hypothetical protein